MTGTAALLAGLCAGVPRIAAAQGQEKFGVLLVTATAGYRHDSIPVATEIVEQLGELSGLYFTTVLRDARELAALSPRLLDHHKVVLFANTSGELPLTGEQREALLSFVHRGGGFVGAHAASDTLHTWPEYGQLVGAYFSEHPWTQNARVQVEGPSHLITERLPVSFEIEDELFVFQTDPRARPETQVLLTLDPASVGAAGSMGGSSDLPLAWCSPYGLGRSFYTALGHFEEVWEDTRFISVLGNGILWAAGRSSGPSLLRASPAQGLSPDTA
jgi:uncharacterized protein